MEADFPQVKSSDPLFGMVSLQFEDEDFMYDPRRRPPGVMETTQVTRNKISASKMLAAEYLSNFLDNLETRTESNDLYKNQVLDIDVFNGGATLVMNSSLNITEYGDLFYRHSMLITILFCIVYSIVFLMGLVGNCFVIAVVLRSPRMRTVTNFFIVNLAVADILVIVFCLPATLMSNIFVRKYIQREIACLGERGDLDQTSNISQ